MPWKILHGCQRQLPRATGTSREYTHHVACDRQVDHRRCHAQFLGQCVQGREIDLGRQRGEETSSRGCENNVPFLEGTKGAVGLRGSLQRRGFRVHGDMGGLGQEESELIQFIYQKIRFYLLSFH